ncbi:MAG: hypothetical protein HZA24_02000 [Nitrospirae bacterium]|nr:hypothetical protein [Nitrospirota bacterium]
MTRTPLFRSLPAIALLAVLVAAPAHATRPYLFTESAAPLPAGGMQLEVGLAHQAWDQGNKVYDLMTEFSYSLYANLDLELELPYEVSGGGGTPFSDGVGDIWAKGKINFVKERAANPLTLSGQLGIKFPTGSAVSGTDAVDVRIAALASKPFGTMVAHANLAYTFVGDDGALDLNDVIGLGVGLESQTTVDRLTAVGEVVWQESPAPGGSERTQVMGGGIYQLTHNMRADATLSLGLAPGSPPNDGAPDYGLSVGLTYTHP